MVKIMTLVNCQNVECAKVYEKEYNCCPYCGHIPAPPQPNMKRVNNICRHLVGTRNTMQSAMKQTELLSMQLYDAVIAKIGRNAETGKWQYKNEGYFYDDDTTETRITSPERTSSIHSV